MKCLLKKDANFDMKSDMGKTILMLECSSDDGSPATIDFILNVIRSKIVKKKSAQRKSAVLNYVS
jgi:hypothetical protein